ncbi:MAG: endonuclease MutS2 [Nitrospinota bacterium]|nr:endonuclease MutS2 [Nitrospinota bacterium]
MNQLPPIHKSLLERSTNLLGWNLIRQALANQAFSFSGQEQCRMLSPETDFPSAQTALRETEEMASLDEAAESLPLSAFEDIRPTLDDVAKRGILKPVQGLYLIKLLNLVKGLKVFFAKKTGLLSEYAVQLDPQPALLQELERCIDDEGEIKDTASPELKQAVRAVRDAKDKLEKFIQKILGNPEYKEAIQDSYATEREGRLVLPVKSEWKTRIDGIVHDSSGSGATLFMEPTKIIPLNNQLKINRIKVEQEKLKILEQLGKAVADQNPELQTNFTLLTTFDLIHAKYRLAKIMQAQPFTLRREGCIQLKMARNPELILDGQQVVANDISWNKSSRVIIISGPNTGGKTVTLKTVGLMALMARAGLLLPVDENSEIGFFPEVYADIGDEQNIQQSLSTFSAHLGKIISILEHALPGSLILLDELGIATDPHQGAAQAEVILMELKQKGMLTLVSTHFLTLKTLAQTQEGFLNACTEFSQESLKPTYKLVFGIPGNSAALETAERLGLHRSIIDKARNIYDEKDTRADELLESLHHQKLELEKERESLADHIKQAKLLEEKRLALTNNLKTEELEFQKSKAKRLQGIIREARNSIQKTIREIKGSRDKKKLRDAENRIRALGHVPLEATLPDLSGWKVPANKLSTGDPVIIKTYGARGKLLEDPRGKKKIRVKLGNMETLVEADRLRGHSENKHTPQGEEETVEVNLRLETNPPRLRSCDLRGMRIEEAKRTLEGFIDQAMIHQTDQIKIIHGHGTGAVKKFVRDYLESCGIGKSFTPGSSAEGGDGVTIVDF